MIRMRALFCRIIVSVLTISFASDMDIVYPLRNCNICEELVYSLRSLENLPHDKIFFVGGFPNNIRRDNITYIPRAQTSTKWENSTENIKTACLDSRVSDNFVLMNDDFFILKPLQNVEKELCFNLGTVEEVYRKYHNRGMSQTAYVKGMEETKQFLKDLGISEPICFELHIPMIFNKQKFLDIFKLPNIDKISVLHWRTVYGNLYQKSSVQREDVKVLIKDVFTESKDKFLSSGDATWGKVKPFLKSLFPNKSVHEF